MGSTEGASVPIPDVRMNRAQRSLLSMVALLIVWKVAQHYLSPTRPALPRSYYEWSGRILLPMSLLAWWVGARRLRQRAMSPERRALAVPLWHATGVLMTVPMAVMAVVGQNVLGWMVTLAAISFVAESFIVLGELAPDELARLDQRRRRTGVVVLTLIALLAWLASRSRTRGPMAPGMHGWDRSTTAPSGAASR